MNKHILNYIMIDDGTWTKHFIEMLYSLIYTRTFRVSRTTLYPTKLKDYDLKHEMQKRFRGS